MKRRKHKAGRHLGPYAEDALARARSDLPALQDDGWMWSETTRNLMVNLKDPEQQIWYDPVRRELFFSPKLLWLIEQSAEEHRADAAG
jgi:hypothetical protein